MKGRIVIECDLADEVVAQIKRTGFSVNKVGSHLRLCVGPHPVAAHKSSVTVEDVAAESTMAESAAAKSIVATTSTVAGNSTATGNSTEKTDEGRSQK